MRWPTKNVSPRKHSRTRRTPLGRAVEALERRTLMAASLIRDVNTVTTDPTMVANVGSTVYFTHVDASGGTGLEKSDGSVDGTQLLLSVSAGTSIAGYYVAGSNLFFTLKGPADRFDLWEDRWHDRRDVPRGRPVSDPRFVRSGAVRRGGVDPVLRLGELRHRPGAVEKRRDYRGNGDRQDARSEFPVAGPRELHRRRSHSVFLGADRLSQPAL